MGRLPVTCRARQLEAKPDKKAGEWIQAGLGRQSQNAGNIHLSLETGPERYRKSRSESLLDLILAD